MNYLRFPLYRDDAMSFRQFTAFLSDPASVGDIELLYQVMIRKVLAIRPYDKSKVTIVFSDYHAAALRVNWPQTFKERGYISEGEYLILQNEFERVHKEKRGVAIFYLWHE